ncbi:hypothetical protein CAEBREN_13910 [Caenorhabditis brenneri]|uniref:Uncharacterized protein n=1 Tax=Caenorhabditis brenneri TaxID=135651 RepID=G0P9I9_CAEBE|nr:hypothetical protein CAEBREN_13910 [Caenorhabditis brenneri]
MSGTCLCKATVLAAEAQSHVCPSFKCDRCPISGLTALQLKVHRCDDHSDPEAGARAVARLEVAEPGVGNDGQPAEDRYIVPPLPFRPVMRKDFTVDEI